MDNNSHLDKGQPTNIVTANQNMSTFEKVAKVVISTISVFGIFYLMQTGKLCSAEFDPEGKFSIAACDASSINPLQMRKIFSTIDSEDAYDYAEAVAINDLVVAEILNSSRERIKDKEFLASLLLEIDDLYSENLSSALNDKKYFSTVRTKLAVVFENEISQLNEELEQSIASNPNIDQQRLIDDYLSERPLLSALRRFAPNGYGPFRPISMQFRASLPSAENQPGNCLIYIPALDDYANRFVKVVNNRTKRELVAFTRPGITEDYLTSDQIYKMQVNSKQALQLDLKEGAQFTGDDVSLIVINGQRAALEAEDCVNMVDRVYRNIRAELATAF